MRDPAALGAEEKHQGVIDLVRMKALVFHDDGAGQQFDVVDIPAELADAAKAARAQLVEAVRRAGRRADGPSTSTGKELTEDELRARAPQGLHRA